ncbi:hypothetical protein Bca52824_056306, partial [Brassica carinata]
MYVLPHLVSASRLEVRSEQQNHCWYELDELQSEGAFPRPNPTDKIVEDATSENLEEPDWDMNLEICDMINQETINSRFDPRDKEEDNDEPAEDSNCEKAFSEVAAERVLDEMVKLIDDPQTVVNNRNKALILIEAWGESTSELRYLPVFEETYK